MAQNDGLRRNQSSVKKAKNSAKKLDLRRLNEVASTAPTSQLGKALVSGGQNTAANIQGAIGAVGGAFGAKDFALEQDRTAQGLRRLAAENAPDVQSFSDVKSPSDAAALVANTVVGQAPNIALTAAGALLGRGLGAKLGAGTTGQRVLSGAGAVVPSAAVEAGSIQNETLADPEARKNNSVADISRGSLGFGTAAGALEALPVTRVLNKFGLQKAGTRAIKQSLGKRLVKEVAKGAGEEALTEAAQTTIERAARKFANENFDILGPQGVKDIIESAGLGAIGGGAFGSIGALAPQGAPAEKGAPAVTTEQRLQDRIDNEAADAELSAARAPGAVKFDKTSAGADQGGKPVSVSSRIVAGHFVKPFDVQQYETQVAPVLKGIISGDVNVNDPQTQAFLNDNFEAPDIMLDRVARSTGAVPQFEMNTILGALDNGAQLTDPTPDLGVLEEVRGKGDPKPADTLGGRLKQLMSEQPRDIQETLGTELGIAPDPALAGKTSVAGEAGPEFGSISEVDANRKKVLAKKVVIAPTAVRKDGKAFETTSTRKKVDELNAKDREAGRPESFRTVSLADTLTQEAKDSGARGQNQIEDFLRPFARKQAKANPQIATRDANGQALKPSEFLKNFEQIEATQDKGGDVLPPEGIAKTVPELVTGGAFRKPPAPGRPQSRGNIGVEVNGENMSLNLMGLAKQFTKDVPFKEGTQTLARVRDLVTTGLASLVQNKGVAIRQIPDDTIVWTSKSRGKKREYTWGEINKNGAAATKIFGTRLAKELKSLTEDPTVNAAVNRYNALAARRREIGDKFPGKVKQINKEIGALKKKSPEIAKAISVTQDLGKARGRFSSQRQNERSISDPRTLQMNPFSDVDIFGPISETRRAEVDAELDKQAAREEKKNTRTDEGGDFETGPDTLVTREGERKLDSKGNDTRVFYDKFETAAQTKAKDLLKKESLAQRKADASLAQKWLDVVGIKAKVSMLSVAEAAQVLKDREGAKAVKAMVNGKVRGFMAPINGEPHVYVSPELTGGARLAVLAHELGHVIFKNAVKDLNTGPANAMWSEFNDWRKSFGRSSTTLDVAVSKKSIFSIMAQYDAGRGKRLGDMTKAERDYVLDFEEWFADNTAKWLNTAAEPRTVVEKFFAGVTKMIKDLWVMVQNDHPAVSVDQFLRSLMPHPLGAKDPAVKFGWVSAPGAKFIKDPGDRVTAAVLKQHKLPAGAAGKVGKAVGDSELSTQDAARIMYSANVTNEQPYSRETAEALVNQFNETLQSNELGLLARVFSNTPTMRKLRKLLADNKGELRRVESDPVYAAAVGYQFWTAGELTVGPQLSESYKKSAKIVRDLTGIIDEDAQVNDLMQAIREGIIDERAQGRATFAVKKQLENTRLQKAIAMGNTVVDSVMPLASKLFFGLGEQLRRTDNPYLIQLADQFQPQVGSERVGESFIASRTRRIGQFTNRLHNIFGGLDKATGQETLDLMMGGNVKGTSSKARAAASQTRSLLNDLLLYQRSKGVKIGDLGPTYFPRVLDTELLEKNKDKFIDMLLQEKYKDNMVAFLDKKPGAKITRQELVDGAERIYQAYVHNFGEGEAAGADAEHITKRGTGAPFNAAAKSRVLSWIENSDVAPFQSRDLGEIMTKYITQAVKRAEYTKRFGEKGDKLQRLFDKAVSAGATKAQLETATKATQAVLGTLGADLDPKIQKVQGAVLVYQNIRLLALSTLTSIVDPIGLAARGDLETMFTGLKAGVRAVIHEVRGQKDELEDLGRMIGTIDDYMTNEALGWEYGGHFMTGKARRVNDWFFNKIQLTRWTRTTRLAALAGARHFIIKHATKPGKHSERFLDQLNLTKDDVKVEKGQLVVLSEAQHRVLRDKALAGDKAAAAELRRDERIQVALNRWIDEAILRPDATQRPIWMSDPRYALVAHLKSFLYSFNDRILRRVGAEASEGNYAPLLHLQLFIPAMMGSLVIREAVTGSGDDNDDETLFSFAARAGDRAGLAGLGTLAHDAMRDIQYGGTGVESFAGPTVQQIRDLMSVPLSSGSQNLDTFVEALPANNLWRDWL